MIRPLILAAGLLAPATMHGDSVPAAYHIQTLAGSAQNGDGGAATHAQIGAIQGIALDAAGNLYLSDTDHHRVRKVGADGLITTVAGTGTPGFSGDGGAAATAQLNLPYGLAVDAAGNLYIADLGNSRIRRISSNGVISTYAGGAAASPAEEGALATAVALRTPRNLAMDPAGNLYVSEFEGHRVRKITPDGRIVTVAGTGIAGFAGDNGPAAVAQLAYPAGLALDRSGSLYIADSQNQRVRKAGLDGVISTVAGSGTPLGIVITVAVQPSGEFYLSAGTGPILACPVSLPCSPLNGSGSANDLALDSAGDLFFAAGNQVFQRNARGQLTLLAGDDYQNSVGDGGPPTGAVLHQPSGLAIDPAGNLYIADSGTNRVRQVSQGAIWSIAGPQNLAAPMGVASAPSGDLFIADTGNHVIRKFRQGVLSIAAGTGIAGAGPEGLPGAQTGLNSPRGVCTANDGSLYIVDTGNHRILRLNASGAIQTAAGNGSPGMGGDGGPARLAQLNLPSACAVDSAGNLLIADTGNHRVRKVSAGNISTIAGADGVLNGVRGVAAGPSGSIFIADSGNNRVCILAADGALHVIAGPEQVAAPAGLALDSAGNLDVADTGNNRILQFTPASKILSVVNAASMEAGPVSPGELLSILSPGIGPAAPETAAFDANQMLPTQLSGWEIRFDGEPAPIVSAQPGQIEIQAPYSLTGLSSHLEILSGSSVVASTDLAVAASAPALFPSSFTQGNPAPRGSVAVFYATGEGTTDGANIAGAAALPPYAHPVLPITLSIAGIPAQLLYAGSAPGTAGILQLNAIIPGGFIAPGPAIVELTAGSVSSPPITIWIQ